MAQPSQVGPDDQGDAQSGGTHPTGLRTSAAPALPEDDVSSLKSMNQQEVAEYISDTVFALYDIAQRSGLKDISAVLKTAGLMARFRTLK